MESNGVQATQTGYTALHFAAEFGYLDFAKQLFNSNVDKDPSNSWGYTPLLYAAARGNVATWELFSNTLEEKNPENSWGWTPCHQAAQNGNLEVLKLILDNLTDKNPPVSKGPLVGLTPLTVAARAGQVDACRLIMKCLKNKNPPDTNGVTPLHSAAARGQLNSKSQKKSPGNDYGESHSKFPVSQLTSLRILTLNVCGFKSHVHIDQVRNSHVKNKVDVAVLTETEKSHDTFNIDG